MCDSVPFKLSKAHALHPRAQNVNTSTPAGPRWWRTPRSQRGQSSTRSQRETSARGGAHRIGTTMRTTRRPSQRNARLAQTPRARNPAACQSTHAAARNHSTLPCDRHSNSSHSPAQARTRAIASVKGRSGGFNFVHCLAGTHTHTHDASARRPGAKPKCAPQMHMEKRWRSAATRRPCATSALPADEVHWPQQRCVTLHPRPPPGVT